MLYISTERKLLKEFSHQDLNLTPEAIEPEGVPEKFMVYQKYLAFFYFIPFLPYGKIYAFQKDGHTYRAPDSIKDHIELEYPVKTPFHYYLGILIMILLIATFTFLIGFISDLLNDYYSSDQIDQYLDSYQ